MIRTIARLHETIGGALHRDGSGLGSVVVDIDVADTTLDHDEQRFVDALRAAMLLAPSMVEQRRRLRLVEMVDRVTEMLESEGPTIRPHDPLYDLLVEPGGSDDYGTPGAPDPQEHGTAATIAETPPPPHEPGMLDLRPHHNAVLLALHDAGVATVTDIAVATAASFTDTRCRVDELVTDGMVEATGDPSFVRLTMLGREEGANLAELRDDEPVVVDCPQPEPEIEGGGPVAEVPARPADRPKGLQMNPESDRAFALLRGLHALGGEIFDPGGKAASQLLDHVALEGPVSSHRTLIAVLDEAGHITRTVNGKRTTRIALTPQGLALIDAASPDEDATPDIDEDTTAPDIDENIDDQGEEVDPEDEDEDTDEDIEPPEVDLDDLDAFDLEVLASLANASVDRTTIGDGRACLHFAERLGRAFGSRFMERLDALVAAGLITWDQRGEGTDRRTNRIAITAAGRLALEVAA